MELNNNCNSSPKNIPKVSSMGTEGLTVGRPLKEGVLHMVQSQGGCTRVLPVVLKVYHSGVRHYAVVSNQTTGQIVRDLGFINLKTCSVDCVEVPSGRNMHRYSVAFQVRPLSYDGKPLVFLLNDEVDRESWISVLTYDEVVSTMVRCVSPREKLCSRCNSWPASTFPAGHCPKKLGCHGDLQESCSNSDLSRTPSLGLSIESGLSSSSAGSSCSSLHLMTPPPRSPSSRTEAGLFSYHPVLRSMSSSPIQQRPTLPSVTEDMSHSLEMDEELEVFEL